MLPAVNLIGRIMPCSNAKSYKYILFFFLKQLVQAEAKCQSYIIYNKADLKKKKKKRFVMAVSENQAISIES